MTSRTPCLAGLRPLSCSCLLTIWVAPENRLAKLRTPRTYCFTAGFSGAPNGVRLQSGRAASGTAHNPGERNLKGNLYKIWNRMSSGSYFPPPVRTVKIPKANGGERKLGIPTVSDRIAQQVVKSRLEPAVDPLFHPDSYGYRPGKSALDAVGQARQRCWRHDWIVDLDIKGFFDNIPQDLLIRAVKKHAKEPWMVLLHRALVESASARGGRPVGSA